MAPPMINTIGTAPAMDSMAPLFHNMKVNQAPAPMSIPPMKPCIQL